MYLLTETFKIRSSIIILLPVRQLDTPIMHILFLSSLNAECKYGGANRKLPGLRKSPLYYEKEGVHNTHPELADEYFKLKWSEVITGD